MSTWRGAGLALLMVSGMTGGAAAAEPEGPPAWGVEDARRLLAEIEAAGRAPSVAAKDAALTRVMAGAYGTTPRPGEAADGLAARALRRRSPGHPEVEAGRWLLALGRRFYLDLSERAGVLARFTRDRRERQWLEARGAEAARAAETLGAELRVKLPGVKGLVELPPRVGGVEPTRRGAKAELVGGRLIIERLPRADFRGGRVPEDAPRTRGGALREVYAALKQFDTTAQMLGRYDRGWREKRGHVQAILPAAAPAAALNELARGGLEAKMRHLHLVTLDEAGAVREVPLRLRVSTKEKKTSKEPIRKLSCEDVERMQACARKLRHAQTQGVVLYRPAQ